MSIRAMKWAWDQDVSGGDKVLLLALADHAGEDGTCYPGQMRLAQKCGVTDRAIRDSIKRLEGEDLVRRERRTREDGSRTSDLYLLPLPEETSAPTGSSTGVNRKPASRLEPTGESSEETHSKEEWKDWLSHYHATTERTSVRGSAPAIRSFTARRNDGYSLDDLKLATEGCHGDEFLRSKGLDVPVTILRPSNVDRYIELGRNGGASAIDTGFG